MATNAQKNRDLALALNTVSTNGQAQAWAARAMDAGRAGAERFSAWSIAEERRWAFDTLWGAVNDVELASRPFQGADDSQTFAAASWDPELKRAIGRLYSSLWAIEQVLPESEAQAWRDFVGGVAIDSIAAVPRIVKDVATGAVDVVKPALWPLALGLAALAIVIVAVRFGAKGAV